MRLLSLMTISAIVAFAITACGSPSQPAAGGASQIAVTLKEFSIEPKEIRAKAGTVTFTVKNAGAIEHDFVIEGIGKLEAVGPGETKTLQVTLQSGSKDVTCTLAGHKEAGMTAKLIVTP